MQTTEGMPITGALFQLQAPGLAREPIQHSFLLHQPKVGPHGVQAGEAETLGDLTLRWRNSAFARFGLEE